MSSIDHYSYLHTYLFTSHRTYSEIQTPTGLPISPLPPCHRHPPTSTPSSPFHPPMSPLTSTWTSLMAAETHGHPACAVTCTPPSCPHTCLACLAVKQGLPAHALCDGLSLLPCARVYTAVAHTIVLTHVLPCLL